MKVSAAEKAVAIVGVGAVLPDAPNAPRFWQNVRDGVYSITEVRKDRWDTALYYDADPKAPDKTYSKIGGWVRDWEWDPLKWRLPIPPRVSQAMDLTQKWGVVTAREALQDYGYPGRPLDSERTAVIYGNAMGGDTHLYSAARIFFPEFAGELARSSGFAALPADVRKAILEQMYEGVGANMPPITEDTMPGELSNILAGRIAALYDFRGPNYVADAACASAMAAITAAISGLNDHDYDAVLTGGIDANMSPSTFVKFCKIGALSATGSRPYAEGADGFVMGEGGVTLLMKRLADAERDGDRIYAVVRSMGASSDGKGKGITAPNPVGQKLCVRRAWDSAGIAPAPGDLIEGHGTSTSVGDAAELESLAEILAGFGLGRGSIALGSVKSNIGHLKGGAGAAGILKAALCLKEKQIPPSLNFVRPNPHIDFAQAPFYVNTALKEWEVAPGQARRAGVSAFGFGGTNFHMVLEEYVPGRIAGEAKPRVAVPGTYGETAPKRNLKAPLRGALVLGAESEAALVARADAARKAAEAGQAPEPAPPMESDLRAPRRLAVDYADAAELADKLGRALKAFEEGQPARWKALRPKGIYYGKGPAPKVAFLFTGQGSQYVNMLRTLRDTEPVVTEVFAEADRTMTPLIGRSLTGCIYLDESDEAALAEAENGLKQTAITQPAVLATETALARLIGAYGIAPDMVMGHSLGEYGALVAAGAITFENALKAVSARGNEMTKCAMADNGLMAAAFGPIGEIQKVLETVDDYVVIANINSTKEAVIGGSTTGVEKAVEALKEAGYVARVLQVSHAFHTKIVAPAGESLARILGTMNIQPPVTPIVTNVTGEFYPMGPGVVPEMIGLLGRQVSSPVQFIKGLNTLYDAGARIFVEMGPKRILYGFVEDVLGDREGVVSLFTNHPRIGEAASLNLALCGLYAAGLGVGRASAVEPVEAVMAVPAPVAPYRTETPAAAAAPAAALAPVAAPAPAAALAPAAAPGDDRITELGRLFAEFLDRGMAIHAGGRQAQGAPLDLCITGAALGLPGVDGVFSDDNVERMLRGDVFIHPVPEELRRQMVEKNITRLVKTEGGEGRFEYIQSTADVIKLAARSKEFDIVRDFGFPEDRLAALDRVTKLAIGAGIDALRDAGIPLVMRYKTTTKGTKLPDRWVLPDDIRDDTGVLFTSAFPGYDSYAEIMAEFYQDRERRNRLAELESLRAGSGAGEALSGELDRRIAALKKDIEEKTYHFDRRFLFRVLSMGHSQFAEYIGARGPNTSTNGACSSGTQAVGIASDWIRAGRCRRVIVISADDITSDNLFGWFGSGFLASGSAATGEIVEEEAIPFDRRRHGLIVGMGASAVVLESAEAARERGIRPICQVLGSVVANSAFHGSRLDVNHIRHVMEKLISQVESEHGLDRYRIAPETVFVSHETYTPARGGSASAEVFALRHCFKEAADRILIANTKGATGHPMAVGIEDVVSAKILETGIVPPVPNFREVDPELGNLNLSKGGSYPVRYILRLGAGFGSQISITMMRWTPTADGRRPAPGALGYGTRIENPAAWTGWLKRLSGYDAPEVEVVKRTLRVRDQGPTAYRENGNGNGGAYVPAAPAAPVQPGPAAAAEAAPASSVPASAAPAVAAGNAVRDKVMAIIAEKTGYPTDMLDLDLDLEADLGIDTVKQAEMFAAIRAAYDIPREDNLKLRDFPTLGLVIQFVYDRRPDLVPAPQAAAPGVAPAATPPPAPGDGVREKVMGIIAEKTGYPTDMLDLDLDLEADLGIDTVKQAEMFAAIRAAYDIPREDNLKLRDFPTLGHVIGFVYDRRPDLAAARAAAPQASGAPQAAAAPVQTAPAQPAPGGEADPVRETVLRIIAEKTGYPIDMLDLDLDLEADLGIDTVKQAEMFAAIRAAYDIPREDNLKLRDFPTLAHVIGFAYDRRPDLAAAKPAAPAGTSASPAHVQAAPAQPAPEAAADPVRDTVLAIIAEKTGYPTDMLDLDLDLEADLGVDTVKQAEMFAAIRTAYDIPREDNLKLREFPTLAHVIGFVYDRKPGLKQGTGGAAAAPAAAPEAAPGTKTVAGSMAAANAVARRVPVPQLRPSLALCKPTGVALGAGSRVVVMPDQGGVARALVAKLEKLGVETLVIEGAPGVDALGTQLGLWAAAGPVQGVYWLAALDSPKPVREMSAGEWQEATRIRAKLLFAAMQALYAGIGAPGTFLVAATRLGGMHGYDEAGAFDPLGGAVTGFAKAFKREKGEATVKAVDFEPSRKTSALADLLIEETLGDPGAVEVGYRDGRRWTVGLAERPAADGGGLILDKDTVFVVTGAAGSIVSAITADLAAASGGTFYLLDMTPEPDPADGDLARLESDRENLKRDIFERLKARGERATPVIVDREMAAIERRAAALAAIKAVRAAGGGAHYRSLDLMDAEAVGRVMNEIRERHGRVDVLLHAAGLEISRAIPDKAQAEFDRVFDVKSAGWFHLLSGAGDMPLGAAVVFSSVAGRFGNAGQTDYSSANDLLCKCVSHFRSSRPDSLGIAIDWTAWSGIGMAARGSIPAIMKQAGIDMLAPEAGIPVVRRELTGGTRGEVVIGQRLGIMVAEFDPEGGLDVRAEGPVAPLLEGRGVMIGEVKRMGLYGGLTVETTLDPAEQPFLYDHQIGGTPVLPGVMGIEGMAEAARLLFPELFVGGVEDVKFLAPFKFYRNQPRALTIVARYGIDGGDIVADCALTGRRQLHGQTEPEITTHFTGRVRLVAKAPAGKKTQEAPGAEGASSAGSSSIYRVYFHGPAYQVIDSAWKSGEQIVGRFAGSLPPNHMPADLPLLIAPRFVELCFQTASLVGLAGEARLGLPYGFERLEIVSALENAPGAALLAVVRRNPEGAYDAEVVDGKGKVYMVLRGYRTMDLPDTVKEEELLPIRKALKSEK